MGISPFKFQRIVRFQHARAALLAGDSELSQIALAAGYYDQSHMTNEFKHIAGKSPGSFLAGR